MRKAMILLAVFGLASSLWAADPSVGTWKANIAKSKITPSTETLPKEATIVVRELGADEFELDFSASEANGSQTSLKVTWPQKGGVLKSSAAANKAESAIVTMIAPGEWYTTSMQDGKQTQLIHSFVSKDGKTMNLTQKGTDAKGKPYETLIVFDKQ